MMATLVTKYDENRSANLQVRYDLPVCGSEDPDYVFNDAINLKIC